MHSCACKRLFLITFIMILTITAGIASADQTNSSDDSIRPATRQDRLQQFGERLAQRLAAARTPLYFDLKSATSGPQGRLNANPDIELMHIDQRGRPLFYQTHNINAARTLSTDDVWSGGSVGAS